MGPLSGNLCVIDIDVDAKVPALLESAPMLAKTFRSRGQRGAAFWVRFTGEYPNEKAAYKLRNAAGVDIGELRVGGGEKGAQSVIWGIHPDTKEAYQWLVEEPVIELEFSAIHWPDGWHWRSEDPPPRSANNHAPSGAATGDALDRRIRAYMAKVPPSVAKSHGDDQLFKAACDLVLGWDLSPEVALRHLLEYNGRAEPPWPLDRLKYKLSEADKQPGPRGFLRDAKPSPPSRVPKKQPQEPLPYEPGCEDYQPPPQENEPDGDEGTRIELPPFTDASAILAAPPEPEPPQLIHGILHQGLKGVLAGASKSMKSWLLLNISVCVATGTKWLERFPTTQSRLLYLNLEVPGWHFNKRLRLVAEALGLKLEPDMFTVWNLRGHDLGYDATWKQAQERISEAGRYGFIPIDPHYKLFNEFRGESETTGMSAVMKRFDALAEATGASPFTAHHFAKGNAASKEALDRFSGSGILARDTDVYLCMTPHEVKDAFVIECVLRCLPPIEPFVIRWKYPLFTIDTQLDPEGLRPAPGKAGRKAKYSVDQFVNCMEEDRRYTDAELEARICDETGMVHSTFLDYRKRAAAQKNIFKSSLDGTWQRYPTHQK
jgi:hypothetical protein